MKLQKKYPDKIRVLSTCRNIGLNRNARNVRLAMRGEIAAFCEADDYWDDEMRLQKGVEYLTQNKSVTLLHGRSKFLFEQRGEFKVQYAKFKVADATCFDRIIDETYRIETATVMCWVADLRSIYDEIPAVIGAKYRMLDTQMFSFLARKGKVAFIDEVFSVRRISGKSLSINDDLLSALKYHDNAFKMKLDLIQVLNIDKSVKRRSVNFYLLGAIGILKRSFRRREVYEIMKILYPEYRRLIMLMLLFPVPRCYAFRVFYYRVMFPSVRFRTFFSI
jgi:hypothetical protein